jgi:hypothetical protein
LDINKLTLGEVATIEDMAGLPIAALSDESKPKGKLLVALAFIIKKRENSKYTKLEAEALTMDDVYSLIGVNEDEADAVK